MTFYLRGSIAGLNIKFAMVWNYYIQSETKGGRLYFMKFRCFCGLRCIFRTYLLGWIMTLDYTIDSANQQNLVTISGGVFNALQNGRWYTSHDLYNSANLFEWVFLWRRISRGNFCLAIFLLRFLDFAFTIRIQYPYRQKMVFWQWSECDFTIL